MWPEGFLGTRADLLMDIIIVIIVIPPILMWYSFRFVPRNKLKIHKNLNLANLAIVLVVVVLFELDVRSSGGSGAFVKLSPYAGRGFLEVLLYFHIAVASITFISWLVLGLLSWKRFATALPGSFSGSHRRWGQGTFLGLLVTAITGVALYVLVFVA
ncbi:MAG: DUF420 domain-containing protein [Spirochaetota bacterium]|nr:DUF420 domain-containing protein [Spirochaetota bacterium]